MIRKCGLWLLFISIFFSMHGYGQTAQPGLSRPKLVVGIVVDQMRWDYLYRYYNRYGDGGFKRLINQGFSCENTLINYLPSYTAVGHTCIFTGSVPSIHGITGNDWTDQLSGASVYCTDDSTVQTVGAAPSPGGKMSPRNLLVSTITDELRDEGNAREFINRIQKIRKDNDYELTDKITVSVEKNDLLNSSIIKFYSYICAEILASDIIFSENISDGVDVEVNETTLKVQVLKNN